MPPCPLRPQKGRPVSRRTKCRVSPITHCWGECGCSNATRLLPQFGYPGVREGGLSIHVPYSSPSMAWYCCFDTQVPLDSGGSPSLRWTRHEAAERSHPGSPALIQLGQVIHVGSLLDNKVHLLGDTHPPVGIDVSALQFGFHSLPHADCVRVPLLDRSSCFGVSYSPLWAGVETFTAH